MKCKECGWELPDHRVLCSQDKTKKENKMLTEYTTKNGGTRRGVRKRFNKYVTLNMTEDAYKNMVMVSNKNSETMSSLMRRAISKEIERNI